MDYKEKYEQGLECLEEILSSGQEKIKMTLLKERLLPFFPELKESEDERIRKALITFFQRFPYDSIEQAGTNAKEAIAWLEKQGEKKSTWSEEDEEYMIDVIAFLEDARECRQNALDCIEWMKQLKERLS